MKLSCTPLSRRQVTSSSSTSAFPKFLGPMNLRNASEFKYGALFILGDLFETRLGLPAGDFAFALSGADLFWGGPFGCRGPFPFFSSYFQWSLWRWLGWPQVKHLRVSTSCAHIARAIFTWRTGSSGMASK